MSEWIKWDTQTHAHTHTHTYTHSAILFRHKKRNKILQLTTIRMALEGIMLSEIS